MSGTIQVTIPSSKWAGEAEMPQHALYNMEMYLTNFVQIECKMHYTCSWQLMGGDVETQWDVVNHQAILGWDNILHGYVPKFWNKLAPKYRAAKKQYWESKLVSIMLTFHKLMWKGRNVYVHGQDIKEAQQRARESIVNKVRNIYKSPPKLGPCYMPVTSVPLKTRIWKTSIQLHDWLVCIEHQQCVTIILQSTQPPGQLTLKQAFNHRTDKSHHSIKFPP